MGYILNRLREPSTYAGFSGLALALGISDTVWSAVAAAAAGVFGLIAVLVNDAKTTK